MRLFALIGLTAMIVAATPAAAQQAVGADHGCDQACQAAAAEEERLREAERERLLAEEARLAAQRQRLAELEAQAERAQAERRRSDRGAVLIFGGPANDPASATSEAVEPAEVIVMPEPAPGELVTTRCQSDHRGNFQHGPFGNQVIRIGTTIRHCEDGSVSLRISTPRLFGEIPSSMGEIRSAIADRYGDNFCDNLISSVEEHTNRVLRLPFSTERFSIFSPLGNEERFVSRDEFCDLALGGSRGLWMLAP